MRKYCLDCVIKHLGQAFVNHIESENGYKNHELLVIGHLAEASEEVYGVSKDLADEIRQYRLMYIKDKSVNIPYFELYEKINALIEKQGCGDCQEARDSFKERIEKK